jgi:ATP-dependent Clp protease ATP-binding subunit ClpA
MFEHCDRDTMTIIDAAFDEARCLGHNYLGTEHLLLALTERRLLADPVASLLPSAQTVRAAILGSVGRPPEGPAELLKRVGVDLEAVRLAVRRTFGDEALERLGRPVHQPWQPWRRPSRRCTSLLAGAMGVAPRVKQAFEHAQRHAALRGSGWISPAGLLLGMIEVEDALSNRVLRDAGIEPDQIRRLLTGTDG